MTQPDIDLPTVVSRDEWRAARIELLEQEKELTRKRDELNAETPKTLRDIRSARPVVSRVRRGRTT